MKPFSAGPMIIKPFLTLMLSWSLSFLPAGFIVRDAWGGPAGGSPDAAGPDRNPFAYPSRIAKEMASPKTGDGKTPAGAKESHKEYALSGILWTDRGGVASINRRIVQEGEMLDEYRVSRIDRNKVTLRKEGEEIVLNLFQSPVVIMEHQEHRSPTPKKIR
jgi:hypothetical protein